MYLRKHYVLLLAALVITSGCQTLTPPSLTRCSIINRSTAECVSKTEIKDKRLSRMLGYMCFSPRDVGEAQKYLQDLVDRFKESL